MQKVRFLSEVFQSKIAEAELKMVTFYPDRNPIQKQNNQTRGETGSSPEI